MKAAAAAGTAKDARPMVEKFGRTGTITEFFERAGKGKVTYAIRQHTFTETRYVVDEFCPDCFSF